MLNICVKFHEKRTFTFREITTSATNEQTNTPDHYGGAENAGHEIAGHAKAKHKTS